MLKKGIKLVVGLILVAAAIVPIVLLLLYYEKYNELQDRYDHIWEIAMNGDAIEAKNKFLRYKDDTADAKKKYGNPDFAAEICDALQLFRDNKLDEAYDVITKNIRPKLKDTNFDPGLNSEQLAFVEEQIEDAVYEKEMKDYRQKKAEELDANSTADKSVPYVGMLVSKINSTTLGVYSESKSIYKSVSRTKIDEIAYMRYSWKENGKTIYVAESDYTTVLSVFDYRNRDSIKKKIEKNNSSQKSTGSVNKSSSKVSKKKYTTEARTVDPDDHDIEAYYEDFKDEFEDEDDAWDDFEDNEEYWDDY